MAPPAVLAAAPAVDAARLVLVERILRTADELERLVRAGLSGAPEQRLVVVTRGGAVAAGSRRRLLVGRGPRCDVVLASRHVSRVHAALVRREDGWWVEDLGSRNGTFCGAERVLRRRLAAGDLLVLGGEPLRVRL